MDTVKIRHPKLDRTIEVPKSAVPHHMRAGWTPVEEKPGEQPVSRATGKQTGENDKNG